VNQPHPGQYPGVPPQPGSFPQPGHPQGPPPQGVHPQQPGYPPPPPGYPQPGGFPQPGFPQQPGGQPQPGYQPPGHPPPGGHPQQPPPGYPQQQYGPPQFHGGHPGGPPQPHGQYPGGPPVPLPRNTHAFISLGLSGASALLVLLGLVIRLGDTLTGLGSLCWVAGLVFSIIGVVKARKGAMGDRASATAALVVSIVLTLALIALSVLQEVLN